MHPVEHLFYRSGALIHLILPLHPLLALYHLNLAGYGAAAAEEAGIDVFACEVDDKLPLSSRRTPI